MCKYDCVTTTTSARITTERTTTTTATTTMMTITRTTATTNNNTDNDHASIHSDKNNVYWGWVVGGGGCLEGRGRGKSNFPSTVSGPLGFFFFSSRNCKTRSELVANTTRIVKAPSPLFPSRKLMSPKDSFLAAKLNLSLPGMKLFVFHLHKYNFKVLCPFYIRNSEIVPVTATRLHEFVFHVQKWSYSLAGRARNFALQCVFRHCDSQSHLGQNIYYAAPFTEPGYTYVAKALQEWMSEREKFNRNRNFKCCGFGSGFSATCCHYRQVGR